MRRRKSRAGSAGPTPRVRDAGLHHGPTPPYDILSEADARRIIDASLALMRETGVGFEPCPQVMDLFSDAGCSVAADGLVKFDPDMVRDALQSVAKSVKVWNRSGTGYIEIDNRHTWFLPGMTAIKVSDLETGEPRESTREDLAVITRVADALPNIDGVCVACKNVPRSDIHGEIDEFRVLAENTTKPLEYLCENAESLGVVIDMAAAIRGGRERLVEKPYFLHIITPLPLYYARTHTDQIIEAVEAGVPVATGTVAIGGASAPITMAGCLVHSLATDFAAIVLSQLVRKGCFCIGGSDVAFMEPATGGVGGFSQTVLADMVMCQVCRILGLPSMTGIGGGASARRFNQDAVWEISATMMQTFFSRPANCDYLGLLDEGITYSLHALVYCDELAGLLRKLWQGIRIDDEMLGIELTRREGPRGNYLAQRHTAEHCRSELWNSRYFGPNLPVSSSVKPDKDLMQRIDDDLREILANHRPEPLPGAVHRRIESIQEAFEVSHR